MPADTENKFTNSWSADKFWALYTGNWALSRSDHATPCTTLGYDRLISSKSSGSF